MPSQTTRSPTPHGRHLGPDLDDGARPLVAGDDREAHPPRVGEDAGHHLDVGPAQARLAALRRARRRRPRRAPAPLGRRPRWVPRRRPPACRNYSTSGERHRRSRGPLLLALHGRAHRRARPPRPPAADAAARARCRCAPGMRLAGPAYPILGRPHPGHDYDTSIRLVLEMLGLGARRARRRLPDQRPRLRAPRRALGHLAGLARLRRAR